MEVRQFQFTAWPDHGVPDNPTPLMLFMRRVKAMHLPESGPIIVHCRSVLRLHVLLLWFNSVWNKVFLQLLSTLSSSPLSSSLISLPSPTSPHQLQRYHHITIRYGHLTISCLHFGRHIKFVCKHRLFPPTVASAGQPPHNLKWYCNSLILTDNMPVDQSIISITRLSHTDVSRYQSIRV